MPDLTGLAQADAVAAIQAAGFEPGEPTETFDPAVPQGNVIDQSPAPGEQAEPGIEVDYSVSAGPEPVIVPDVSGIPEADAVIALEAAGLTVGERIERTNRRVAAGDVIRTRPEAGEIAAPGSTVELFISIGQPASPSPSPTSTPQPTSALATVPDVSGLPESDAIAAIEAAGLLVGEITERTNRRVPTGAAIRTRPEAGEIVEPGTAVELVISVGEPATPTPVPTATVAPTPTSAPTPLPSPPSPALSPIPSPAVSPIPSPAVSPIPASPVPAADDLLARVQEAGVLRVNVQADDPGWSVVRPNGQARGYSVQVANRVAEQLGVEIAFTTEPQDVVLAGGWDDRWDLSFDHLVATDSRAAALAFSQPYAWEPITFATASATGVSPDDLTGRTVCAEEGSLADAWFQGFVGLIDATGGQAVPPQIGSLVTAGSDDECLAAILDGSVDGWASGAPAIATAVEDGAAVLVATAPAGWAPVAAAVDPATPGHETLLAAVDAAIAELRDDGTLADLSQRALGIDAASPPEGVAPGESAPEETIDG